MCLGTCNNSSTNSKVSAHLLKINTDTLTFWLTYLIPRLGIVHATAGAAALVFSMNEYSLEHQILFMFSVSIAIIVAMGINNLSDKRQYPTSWPVLSKFKKMYGV